MYRVKKTKLIQAFSIEELEGYINQYLDKNANQTIVDVKIINPYERDISPEFLDLEEDGKTREEIFTAMLLFGEEI